MGIPPSEVGILVFHGHEKVQAFAADAYAMLAAESLGLGSCMLGTTAALNRDKSFRRKYGIPVKNKIGLGLIFGHPAVKFPHGIRRRLASVAFA